MKPILVLAALLCAGSPAVAQSAKVYTNADLTSKPVATWTKTVTPEEWRGLVARQFVAPPEAPGASAFVLPWSGDRPGFLPDNNRIVMAGSGSYADDLWRDPVTAYALQHPIEAAYGFSFRAGPRHASPRHAAPVQASTPTAAPTPTITTSASSAGRRVR